MTISRRSLLAGLAVMSAAGVVRGASAATRPTITVYKDPT
jgi:hypothetical protein